jgi:hypothetical protein
MDPPTRNDFRAVAEAILEVSLDGEIDCSSDQACVAEHELPRREADGIGRPRVAIASKLVVSISSTPTWASQTVPTSQQLTEWARHRVHGKVGLLLRAPPQRHSRLAIINVYCALRR